MIRIPKQVFAAAIIVALGVSSAFAGQSPAGTWQTKTGESRFEVSLCGDGTEVCAKLVWLREDARTAENLAYLNSYVLLGAKRALETLPSIWAKWSRARSPWSTATR